MIGSTTMTCSNAVTDMTEAKAANARICPTATTNVAGTQSALQETEEISRHDQSDDPGAEAFDLAAHTKQCAE